MSLACVTNRCARPTGGTHGRITRGPAQRTIGNIATTLLHERLPWVWILLYPTASEREEGMLAMLFWALAALAVVGALAIDWGL
jgi:hypothetical protein